MNWEWERKINIKNNKRERERDDSDNIPGGRGYWAPVCCCCCWYGGRDATGSSKGLLTLMLSLVDCGALPDELIYKILFDFFLWYKIYKKMFSLFIGNDRR